MRILKANELFFLSPHLARSTDKEGLLVAYYTGDQETDLVRRICGLRTLSVWHCQSFVKFILRIVLWTFWKSFPILFSRHTFGLEARGRLNISIDPCTSPGLAESLQSFLEKSGKRKAPSSFPIFLETVLAEVVEETVSLQDNNPEMPKCASHDVITQKYAYWNYITKIW